MGLFMKGDKSLVAIITVAFLVILSSYAVSKLSPSANFSVTPEFVYFNWTNATINVTSNIDGTNFSLHNTSTSINPMFFQTSQYPIGTYGNLNSSKYAVCFTQKGILVENQSGIYRAGTSYINAGQSTLLFLRPHMFCPPGKYQGNFTIFNNSNITSPESVDINATIVIPISLDNTLNQTTKSGFFKGWLTSNQALDGVYHSFYVNSTQIVNASSFTLKLTPSSGNVDLFLFNEAGTLLGQSMNTSSNSEEITIPLPSSNERWEIRVYGNTTGS
jgi:hypothetical protein